MIPDPDIDQLNDLLRRMRVFHIAHDSIKDTRIGTVVKTAEGCLISSRNERQQPLQIISFLGRHYCFFSRRFSGAVPRAGSLTVSDSDRLSLLIPLIQCGSLTLASVVSFSTASYTSRAQAPVLPATGRIRLVLPSIR